MRPALRFLARTGLIVSAATAAGAVYAAARGFSWVPDFQEIERKEALRQEVLRRQEDARRAGVDPRERFAISLEELRARIDAGDAVFLDARSAADFEKGHLFVESWPGVLNVEPTRVFDQLDRLSQLLGQTLILYCNSPDCELAEELIAALEATQLGFDPANMRIFIPGWEGIVRAGLPTTSGPDAWTGDEASLPDEPSQPAPEDPG